MVRSRKGFTLVEMIVVMAVFMAVIIIAGDSFKTILTHMTKITKSEESNIEGIIGLEMFRHDIQQAGYGLPDAYLEGVTLTYFESGFAPASDYNDAPSGVPRAVAAGDDLAAGAGPSGLGSTILVGTDYLALKASTLGLNEASQRWTYVQFGALPHVWQNENLAGSDRVIVLRRSYTSTSYSNELITDASSPPGYAPLLNELTSGSAFVPTLDGETYFIYGINGGAALGMPFNRADYFVATPTTAGSMPAVCAPGTGVLYKAVVNHSSASPGGTSTYVPLMDCVADMPVMFGWDLDDGQGNEGQDGLAETYSTPEGTTVAPAGNQTRVTDALADPERLRKSLKVIKVYILAQNGRRDTSFQGPASVEVGDALLDTTSKTYNFTAAMRNYRWKVYRIVVQPKNLVSNQ